MSKPNEERPGDDVPLGAACVELTSESDRAAQLSPLEESVESEIESLSHLPRSPRTSPTFSGMIRDLYLPQRRYSTFLSPHDVYHRQPFNRNQRHASLPFIAPNHISEDFDLKKMMEDSSRRSSFESAYHSQRSDPVSRTANSSQMEFLNDMNPFTDGSYFLPNQTYGSDEHIERQIAERRDSLSYEAIRTYFLEQNPYIHEVERTRHCLDHRQLGSSSCPMCRRRRSSLGLGNLNFRTSAHQAVIERQFEDLSNIPEPRQSRSTSIDIFGGLGLPFLGSENQPLNTGNTSNGGSCKMEKCEEDDEKQIDKSSENL